MLDTSIVDETWSKREIEDFYQVAIKVEKTKMRANKKIKRELAEQDFGNIHKSTRQKLKRRIKNSKTRITQLKAERANMLAKRKAFKDAA